MTLESDTLDPRAILSALGVSDAGAVERAQGGSDTDIWRVARPDGVYALRLFRAGDAEGCAIERATMEAASAAGLPVPTVHAAGVWRERPALLLTWLPGQPLLDELRRRPWRAWRLGLAFGRAQAAIHALAAPSPLSEDRDAWIRWLGPTYPELAARLHQEPQPGALLHLDYHPLNVLTDGRSVTGVLDWRNALAGPPRADAARTQAILLVDRAGDPSLAERALRWTFARAWRAGYTQVAGPLGDMRLYNAWAGAVMLRDLTNKRDAAVLARIAHWTARQWAQARR